MLATICAKLTVVTSQDVAAGSLQASVTGMLQSSGATYQVVIIVVTYTLTRSHHRPSCPDVWLPWSPTKCEGHRRCWTTSAGGVQQLRRLVPVCA
jgi:hypothetical protein